MSLVERPSVLFIVAWQSDKPISDDPTSTSRLSTFRIVQLPCPQVSDTQA
jgi:hypothetical protein